MNSTAPEPLPRFDLRRLRRIYQAFFLLVFLGLAIGSGFGILRNYAGAVFLWTDPLLALTSLVASRTLYRGLVWAVLVMVATMGFGRIYCGWLCPLGTLNQIVSRLPGRSRREEAAARNRYRHAYALKYYLLAASLGTALLGLGVAGLLDPIALLTRSLATSILPTLGTLGVPLYLDPPGFRAGWVLGAIFIAILALNLAAPRLWCRLLCPLGALLGIVGRLALFRVARNPDRCNGCGRCQRDCQGADEPATCHRQSECVVCLNCEASCPTGAIRYRLLPPLAGTRTTVDADRRRMVGSLVGGAVAVPLLGAADGRNHGLARPAAIRPPGALAEPAFLERCVRCGECMRVCPPAGLQPALLEAGLEGLWTPVLIGRLGYCQYSCIACGQVCPTGAIQPFSLAEKLGLGGFAPRRPAILQAAPAALAAPTGPIRIGTAFIDRGRCLPWALGRRCIVCEEVCPTSPKAVWLEDVEESDASGQLLRLQRPRVDPQRCIGCALCENRCPVQDRRAIYVTSFGESRSPSNRLLQLRSRGHDLPEQSKLGGG